MANAPDITLPRLPDESARAYAARVEYVTMGPGRSMERLLARPQSAPKAPPTRRIETLKDWSVKFNWPDSARQYDEQVAYLTVQEAAEDYRADLADYRKRYGDMGKALLGVAAKLLNKLNKTAGSMEVGPGALSLITNAAKAAADLEALALRVEHLLNNEPGHEQSL